jgi:GntR family transcriptional regulator
VTRTLWQSILNDLRERIDRGEFGGRFPTDHQLMATYDVSRHTVREAVRRLQSEGLVKRERGRGSFLVTETHEQPLGAFYSLFRSIEDAGGVQDSVVIARRLRRDSEAAAVLDVAPDSELFYLERLRLADGEPLAHDRTWLPLEPARGLLGVDFSHTSLYEQLAELTGCHPDSGTERIRPVVPDVAEALRLGLEPGAPAFEIDRRTFVAGSPIEWRITIVRGDRYALRADWGTATTDVSTRLLPC